MSVARYLALGDSYTIGEGVTESQRWPLHLAQLLRAEGVDVSEPEYIARTAWTTDELLDAIDEADPHGPYDLVTLLVGVNDQYRARPARSFEAGFRDVLRRAIKLAGKRASRLVALSIPDWGATPFAAGRDGAAIARDVDGYNALAQAAVAERGAAWVDVTVLSRRMVKEPALVIEDGLHPSSALYLEWAKLAVPAAMRALKPQRQRRESGAGNRETKTAGIGPGKGTGN